MNSYPRWVNSYPGRVNSFLLEMGKGPRQVPGSPPSVSKEPGQFREGRPQASCAYRRAMEKRTVQPFKWTIMEG